MGEGKREMYGVWSKIKDRGFHLRTREGVGAGRDGHGRQYPPYLQAVRNYKDQDRSSDGWQSQASKIVFLGIEEIKNASSMRQAIQVEEKNEWSNRIEGDKPMTAMTPKQVESSLMAMNRKYADLNNSYGTIPKLVGLTSNIASTKTQTPIHESIIITILAAYAEAKMILRPEITDNYDDMIMWTIALQGYYNEKEDKGLPRVEKSLSAAMAAVDASMREEVK